MKITQIRLGKLSVPLRTPFKTALRTVDRVEDIVVELHTDTGAVGYGEAPPTGPITGDTTGGIVGGILELIAPALLGQEVKLLSAFGEDIHGQQVAASCQELGIDASHVLRVPGGTTSTYLYIADPQGEMVLAVSDMEICNQITPSYLAANLSTLQNAQVVVTDTNIPRESLVYLAENCTAPLFCDPVSTKKAEKLLPILHRIHTLKPNRVEAELLSGVSITSRQEAEKAARVLLDKGVQRVFLSMGGQGIYAAQADEQLWVDVIPGKMVSTTGCGDSAAAALAWAYMEGLGLEEAARACVAAGSITMESIETINPAMSSTLLQSRMGL